MTVEITLLDGPFADRKLMVSDVTAHICIPDDRGGQWIYDRAPSWDVPDVVAFRLRSHELDKPMGNIQELGNAEEAK